MNTNTSLRMAVALLLSTAMHGTMAASLTDPIKIADEEPDFTGTINAGTTTGFGIDVPVISGRRIASTTPYYVVITLKNGATFSTGAASLECNYAAANDVAAATDSPAAASGGTVAAFRLQSAGNANGLLTANTCKLKIAANAVNGALQLSSGKKDYGVVVTARHLDPADYASASQSGTLITFTQGMQVSVVQGFVTVDVTSPSVSKKFYAPAGATNTKGFSAHLGQVKYGAVDGVVMMDGAPTDDIIDNSLGRYVQGGVTLFVSGAPLMAVQQTSISPASDSFTAGIFLGTDAKCNASAVGGALAYASGTQVSFTVSLIDYKNLDGIMNVCMQANGVSTIDRGTVSFALTPGATSLKPNMGIVDATLVKVVKNGTSLKVLNIPNPENLTDQAFIRFYNMTSNTGKVYGTLYGQNGAVLGKPNTLLIDNMAKDTVSVLSAVDLATKLVISKDPITQQSWPGRAWLQIESEIKGLRIQALVRSNGPGGVLMNMSDRILTDDEKFTQR